MNKFLGLVLLLAPVAHAEIIKMPVCEVIDSVSAKACMKKVAKGYERYEEPNRGQASANKAVLLKVLKAIGIQGKAIQLVEQAAYVGYVVEYGDEIHLRYIAMKMGTAKPVEVRDQNLVDLAYDLKSLVTVSDLFLNEAVKTTDYAYQDAVENMPSSL